MSDQATIEAAARAIYDFDHHPMPWSNAKEEKRRDYRDLASIVLDAATPLIRAAALEEAAKAAETRDLGDRSPQDGLAQEIAAAIRAQVLEEAAVVAESFAYSEPVAAAIRARALKERP